MIKMEEKNVESGDTMVDILKLVGEVNEALGGKEEDNGDDCWNEYNWDMQWKELYKFKISDIKVNQYGIFKLESGDKSFYVRDSEFNGIIDFLMRWHYNPDKEFTLLDNIEKDDKVDGYTIEYSKHKIDFMAGLSNIFVYKEYDEPNCEWILPNWDVIKKVYYNETTDVGRIAWR